VSEPFHEERRRAHSTRLGTGTMACPLCDAPVMPTSPLSPADLIVCPYCLHSGIVRDFLSLAPPTRPARVAVYVTFGRRPEPNPAAARRGPPAGGS
jgi:hypothetical protein